MDNLLKPLLDSMEGLLFEDDSHIVYLEDVSKYWSHSAGIEVEVAWFPDPRFKPERVICIDKCANVIHQAVHTLHV